MKRKKSQLVLFGVLMLCTIFATQQNKQNKSTRKEHKKHVTVDPLIAEQQATEINTYIEQNTPKNNDNFKELLVQRFPFISGVEKQTDSCGSIYYISVYAPFALINDTHVLTQHGELVPKTVFSASACQSLYAITVNNLHLFEQMPKPQLLSMIQQIPSHLFEHYAIVFEQPTYGLLYDPQSVFAIAFNPLSGFPISLVDRCKLLKKEYERAHTTPTKKKSLCIADIRFDNRIILRSEMGGRRYG